MSENEFTSASIDDNFDIKDCFFWLNKSFNISLVVVDAVSLTGVVPELSAISMEL